MRRICLALPTDRACPAAIAAVGEEAAWAARVVGVEVHFCVLDTTQGDALATNATAVRALPRAPGLVVHHLDEAALRAFVGRTVERAGVAHPGRLLEQLVPDDVSYGACTDRAFLVATALGCVSVHRRDSDSAYQRLDGEPVFPIVPEVRALGRRAADVVAEVSVARLDPTVAHRPVALVGGSFVGEMSVDVGAIRSADPAIHDEIIGLSLPSGYPDLWRPRMVSEAFRGAGDARFDRDHTVLGAVSPRRVDMCNIGLDRSVFERVPLPAATATIGTDYFLTRLVQHAALPGVLHNRHIVNRYTPDRRTGPGFVAYHLRFVRFILSTTYFHAVDARLAAAGGALLDDGGLCPALVEQYVAESATLDRAQNEVKLDALEVAYRALGGVWTSVADALVTARPDLVRKAAADMEDFAVLVAAWGPLVDAARCGGGPGDD